MKMNWCLWNFCITHVKFFVFKGDLNLCMHAACLSTLNPVNLQVHRCSHWTEGASNRMQLMGHSPVALAFGLGPLFIFLIWVLYSLLFTHLLPLYLLHWVLQGACLLAPMAMAVATLLIRTLLCCSSAAACCLVLHGMKLWLSLSQRSPDLHVHATFHCILGPLQDYSIRPE